MPKCPLPPGSRVIGYGRDSGNAKQERSVPQQVEAYENYIRENRLVSVGFFKDEAKPGSSTVGRDDFNKMLKFAERKPRPADGVVLWSSSRFARNVNDSRYLKAKLRRLGYAFIYLSGDVPEMGKATGVIEAMVEWKDDEYLEQLGRDVSRGIGDARREGHWHGFAPTGYKKTRVLAGVHRDGTPRYRSELSIDPAKRGLIKKVFALRAQGASLPTIAKRSGIGDGRKRNGVTTVQGILSNPVYKGRVKVGGEWVDRPDLALVSDAIWQQAQAVNAQRAVPQRNPRRIGAAYVLSGLLYCACGKPMAGKHHHDSTYELDYWYYQCSWVCGRRMHRRERIEQAVLDRLVAEALSPDGISRAVELENERRRHSNSGADVELETARASIRGLERETANILETLKVVPLSPTLATRLADCEQQLATARARVGQLEHALQSPIPLPEMLDQANDYRGRLASGEPDIVRATLWKIVEKITVDGENITIVYKPLPL